MQTKITFIFLFIVCSHLQAQQTTECNQIFSGIVLDGETNTPFSGAIISISEINKSFIANKLGEFIISGLCEGKYTVKYSFVGYKTYQTQYVFNKNIFDKIALHTDTCSLESITIIGEKSENELITMTQATLKGKYLDRTRGFSLAESLKEIPGVTTYNTGVSVSKPVIHGLHSNRILIVNNGLRQEGQQWGSEHAPEIDPLASHKITVIKGAAGVRYGSDAVGGVILLEPKEFRKEHGLGGEFNLVGFSNNGQGMASGFVETKFNKIPQLNFQFHGTIKQAGDASSPNYILSNSAFQERNFSYRIGFIKEKWGIEIHYSQFNTKLGILLASHTGSLSDLALKIKNQKPNESDIQPFSYQIRRPYQNVEHEIFKFSAFKNLNHAGKLSLILGYQFNEREEFDRHKPLKDIWKDNPQLQLKLTTYTADLIFEHNKMRNLTGTWGISNMSQNNTWKYRFLIPNYESFSTGIFMLETWRKNKIELELGARFDFKSLISYSFIGNDLQSNYLTFHSPSGTIGVNYLMNKSMVWKTNLGSTFRPPSINELYSNGFHHGAAAMEYGNSSLKPEQSFKLISSLEYNKNKLSSEISFHYNFINGFIYRNPISPETTIRGAFPAFQYSQTDAFFYGLDATLKYEFTNSLSLLGQTSMVNAWNFSKSDWMLYTPPYRFLGKICFEPSNGLFAKKYKPFFSFSCSHTSKQENVPLLDDKIIPLPSGAKFEIIGGDFMPAPQAYTLFGFEMGTDFYVGKQLLQIHFQVNNLFDVSYRDYMNRFRYYADEAGRNFILRLKVPFEFKKNI